jgi:hypothetical protein
MPAYAKSSNHTFGADIKESISLDLVNKIDNFKSAENPFDMALTTRNPHPFRCYLWRDYYIERELKDGEFVVEKRQKADPKGKGKKVARDEESDSDADSEGRADDLASGMKQSTKTRIRRLIPDRIMRVKAFVMSVRTRLASIPEENMDKPFAHPLVEVGYSYKCISRLIEHAAHRNSNYLMNLWEAIFAILRSEYEPLFRNPRPYHLDQTVIYLIWFPKQAEISEIGWTKLAEGYTRNGGGFSHYPAGLSNASANSVPATQWSSALSYMLTDSSYERHLQHAEGWRKCCGSMLMQIEASSHSVFEQR